MDFWERIESIVNSSEIVIDRPKGSSHPKYQAFIYPLDYGYLTGTSGGDGNEIDIWVGTEPSRRIVGIMCTADTLKNDTEIKILLGCNESEISILEQFYGNNQYMSGLMIKK